MAALDILRRLIYPRTNLKVKQKQAQKRKEKDQVPLIEAQGTKFSKTSKALQQNQLANWQKGMEEPCWQRIHHK